MMSNNLQMSYYLFRYFDISLARMDIENLYPHTIFIQILSKIVEIEIFSNSLCESKVKRMTHTLF